MPREIAASTHASEVRIDTSEISSVVNVAMQPTFSIDYIRVTLALS